MSSTPSAPSIVVPKVDEIELLEEDDEFEEFVAESWTTTTAQQDEDATLWGDNWDDADAGLDEFNQQLRAELAKPKQNNAGEMKD